MINLNILLCCKEKIESQSAGFNWAILVSTLVAIIGWYFVHYYAQERDLKNKKREITLNYLITSYRILANEILQREPHTPEAKRKLEDVLSELQLFGSLEQVIMAQELAKAVQKESTTFDISPLINSLRESVRSELKLKKVEGNMWWARF